MHVEVASLFFKLHIKQNIEVKMKMDETGMNTLENKSIYKEIMDYVLEHTGLKVSNLYIAQV